MSLEWVATWTVMGADVVIEWMNCMVRPSSEVTRGVREEREKWVEETDEADLIGGDLATLEEAGP